MRSLGALAALGLGGILLTACGGSPAVVQNPAVRQVLRHDVLRVANVASNHKWRSSAAALATLRHDVSRFEADGRLSKAAGARVLAAANSVKDELVVLETSTTTTTSPPTTTTTVPPSTAPPPPPGHGGPPPGHDGHGHGGPKGGPPGGGDH